MSNAHTLSQEDAISIKMAITGSGRIVGQTHAEFANALVEAFGLVDAKLNAHLDEPANPVEPPHEEQPLA